MLIIYCIYKRIKRLSRKNILIKAPQKENAQGIFSLVKKSKILDVNSEYLYLLQATHFKDYCSVALDDKKVIGFVSGYLIPNESSTLFIWQVAVDEEYRGNDLARKLILNIIKRDKVDINFVNTTVSPSNKASLRVFEKLSNELNTNIEATKFFEVSDFENQHEEEVLYKIGPFEK